MQEELVAKRRCVTTYTTRHVSALEDCVAGGLHPNIVHMLPCFD